MNPVVMIALDVGVNNERHVDKYADGEVSVELERPAQFGKLSDQLAQYDVLVDKWPCFLKEALTLNAWLWTLEYHDVAVGMSVTTTLSRNFLIWK